MAFLIWLVGLLSGIGLTVLVYAIQNGRVKFKWLHWLILSGWYLGFVFVVGFIATSFSEGEPQAAGMATLIFGGTYLVISILLYRFIYSSAFKASSGANLEAG